jgi:glycosyltransferase involved in cell wall biosynthesis
MSSGIASTVQTNQRGFFGRIRSSPVISATDPAPRSPGNAEGCAILALGSLIPRKGPDVLMRALATLFDLDWTLTIAGAARDPVYGHGLTALAEELGIAQRVTFAGEVDGAALDTMWQGADAFALASHWEGYGMAVAEALARGLPVGVTSGGALAELVPVEAGIVSPPGDHVSLGKAMRRIVFDRELRAEMADAAWAAGQKLPRWEDRAAAFALEIGTV